MGRTSPSAGPPDEARVLEALQTSSRGPMRPKALAEALGVGSSDYRALRRVLRELERTGRVYRVKGGRYAVPDKINLVAGKLATVRSGDGFVTPDRPGKDLFVPSADLGSAMDGDLVVVRIERRPRGRNPVARVVRVLERAHVRVVGTYRGGPRFTHVVPRNRKVMRDILVPSGEAGEAADGDVVLVEITSYGEGRLNPVGAVVRVLGCPGESGVDVLAIVLDRGLPMEFPREVEVEAARVAASKAPSEVESGRTDRRDLHSFTIDPSDARDHDDALSVSPLGEGFWEVGVHIADVSHYVEEGGLVDGEAWERGTSIYLVDRVIPMLPHVLSSGVCSLTPDEDRYAVSLFVLLDAEGTVHEHRFERTVIRSRCRLDYEQAQAVLDGELGVDPETDEALRRLARLAGALRRERLARGSIDFDLPEARVILGEAGDPLDIQRVSRLASHRLVEDMMLLANEIVARVALERELPVLYRVHESPSPEKVEALRAFLSTLGHTLPRREPRPGDFKELLERVEGSPEHSLVSTVVLRSMQRARYSAVNLGHFGLAAERYCHFTSPIRRYPDLVTHRSIVSMLGSAGGTDAGGAAELENTARHASEREQVAAEVERESIELKKIEFMRRHLGSSFTGTVSGVTSFGCFVLLDRFFVEGLVHVSALGDDYYEFRDEEYSLVGTRRGRRFRMGDRLKVVVARVDPEERHINFVLVSDEDER